MNDVDEKRSKLGVDEKTLVLRGFVKRERVPRQQVAHPPPPTPPPPLLSYISLRLLPPTHS